MQRLASVVFLYALNLFEKSTLLCSVSYYFKSQFERRAREHSHTMSQEHNFKL